MPLDRLRAAACAALVLFAAACADDLPTDAAATAEPVDAATSILVSDQVDVIAANGTAHDVNSYGVTVGSAWIGAGDRALWWSPTAGLDTLPPLNAGDPRSVATGINDLGRIVGYAMSAENVYVPVVWSSSTATPASLGSLVAGRSSQAHDINRAGMIVGTADVATGVTRAVVWTAAGTMLSIDPGSTGSTAVAVNDSGKVAGSRKVSGRWRAYVWTQAGGFQMLPIGGDSSVAADINTRGDVAGSFWEYGQRRAFVWSPRTGLNDLGTFDESWGAAYAINDVGTVAGEKSDFYGKKTGLVWTVRSGARRLSTAGTYGWARPYAINRQGHVAGARFGNGGSSYESHMARWTVTEVNSAPSLTLLASALTLLEGDSITLDARPTDPELDWLSFAWSFGDGSTLSHPPYRGSIALRRTWADQGTYPVRVIVQDPSGLRDTASVTVTVQNRTPTATFVVPAYTYEGRTYALVISNLVDGAADKKAGVQASWDCGAGFSAWAVTTRITCPALVDDDSVIVGVRIRDKDGAFSEYEQPFVIYNAQPVVTAAAVTSTSINAGGSFTARGSFNDAGAQDGPWLVRYFWGDGKYSSTTVTARGTLPAMSHVYPAAGSYPVTVYVTDKDGRNGKSTPITVTVAP